MQKVVMVLVVVTWVLGIAIGQATKGDASMAHGRAPAVVGPVEVENGRSPY